MHTAAGACLTASKSSVAMHLTSARHRTSQLDDLGGCLGAIGGLDQPKLYALMEDSLFVYRSMYVDHLARWLAVYPPEAMLIIASEHMKQAAMMQNTMMRFARFLGLPDSGPRVHHEFVFKASPASKDGLVHENGRTYIAKAPRELAARLYKAFCPKNQELAQLLLDMKLISSVGAIPWLAAALNRDVC